MNGMRPGDAMVLAISCVVAATVGAGLGSLADLEWLWVLGLLALVPAGALLLVACIGYGVALGLRLHLDEQHTARSEGPQARS
mgnify:CR=1 FL=1